ncbi:MAG: hypothetical protein QXQ54_06265 [Thermoplasmata archaeon]
MNENSEISGHIGKFSVVNMSATNSQAEQAKYEKGVISEFEATNGKLVPRTKVKREGKGEGHYLTHSNWDNNPADGWCDAQRKSELTILYLQPYQKDNLLGIQYWFYYPFHDDPGTPGYGGPAYHPHDWWYFWVVYDISAKKPVKVVYDFHHSLRAQDFTDSGRVKREGLHVYTYHDAGGHRTLWDAGEQPSYWDLVCLSSNWSLADVYEGRGYPIYTTRDVLAGDKLFGTMIEYLKNAGVIASWRDANRDWNEGVTLRVENFQHWVWVYGVEYTPKEEKDPVYGDPVNGIPGQRFVRVFFTGDNIYTGMHKDWWPTSFKVESSAIQTFLPWMVGDSMWGRTASSSGQTVRQAWEWKTSPSVELSPTTTTIYYDGSHP